MTFAVLPGEILRFPGSAACGQMCTERGGLGHGSVCKGTSAPICTHSSAPAPMLGSCTPLHPALGSCIHLHPFLGSCTHAWLLHLSAPSTRLLHPSAPITRLLHPSAPTLGYCIHLHPCLAPAPICTQRLAPAPSVVANEDEKPLPNRKSMLFPVVQTLQVCDARPVLCPEQGPVLPATRMVPVLVLAELEQSSIALPTFHWGFWADLQTFEINNIYARRPLPGQHSTRCLLCSLPPLHRVVLTPPLPLSHHLR